MSRNTVVRAYEELSSEGYVEARPASCVAVAADLPDSHSLPADAAPGLQRDDAGDRPAMPMPALALRAPDLVHRNRGRLSFDFFPGRPDAGLFPIKTWRRLIQNCLSHGGAVGLSQYGDPAGAIALRTAIASHLAMTRGIVAEASRVIIVGGIQEGINIAARLFLAPGAASIVENPGYQGASCAFEATGAEVLSGDIDAGGLMVDALPERPVALAYVTPSHQYPTGFTLAATRRGPLIAWARRVGCYILEDDYDCDFRYEGSPQPAIAALAPDCTIYLGTFSKSLGAGLRLGYMVVPAHLADAVRTMKTLLNNGSPWLEQAVLADMMRSGSYAAHLSRVRPHYRARRDALLAALHRYFGLVEVSGESGGLHVFWQLPADAPDAATVEVQARRAAGRRLCDGLGRRPRRARHRVLATRADPRLRGAGAEADRGGNVAARQRSSSRRCRARSAPRRCCVQASAARLLRVRPPREPAIWLPTIVSRRLCSGGRKLGQVRGINRARRPSPRCPSSPPSIVTRSRD